MTESSEQREFNLRDYWQIVVRRRWLIVTCVLVATVAALVSSLLATPVYRATCTLAIERTGVRVLRETLSSAEPSWLDYQNWYNTQYQIMQSDEVLRRAVDLLDLMNTGLPGQDDSRENRFFSAIRKLRTTVVRTLSRTQVPIEEDDPYAPYVKTLRGGLSVEPIRDSQLVTISFVHPDRVFAARVANALAEAYIRFSLAAKLDIAAQSEAFLVDQVRSLKEDINRRRLELHEYAMRHNIVTGDANEVSLQNLQDLRNRRVEAEADLEDKRARYQVLTSASPDSIDEVRQHPTIAQLSAEVARLERDYANKRVLLGERHPDVQQIATELAAGRERLASETERIARQVREAAKIAYEQARRRAEGLRRLYEETEQRVSELQQAFVEYEARKAEIDRKQATLRELLDRKNQMTLSASLAEDRALNIRVIEKATPPRMIFKPKKKLNVALGFLFGLFLGIGAAFVMEYVDNTIKTPDDVRDVLQLPVLGMIPAQEPATRRERRRSASRGGQAAEIEDPSLISARAPLSPVAEAYRELRTAVLLAMPDHPPRTLAVTSCQPGEGKTTTAINLATTLAQLGRRVLVVDTDLRRPRCHQILKASTGRGVSTYLTGMSDLPALVQTSDLERVAVIPAGPIPPNPAELLDSERFRTMVRELEGFEDFDHVIFDSPPVLSVVDPLLIGRQMDGTILVLRSAYTSRDAGRLGVEKLRSGRVPHVLGVVLNAVHVEHVPYQYRYYRSGYKQAGADSAQARRGAKGARRTAAGGRG
ncbi:MAG: polysaccharide biosynthesis tyrosine autokinase [Acidobacteriota bacterium]